MQKENLFVVHEQKLCMDEIPPEFNEPGFLGTRSLYAATTKKIILITLVAFPNVVKSRLFSAVRVARICLLHKPGFLTFAPVP